MTPGGIEESILARIGRTPLVRLRRMPGTGAAQVLAKCEQMNPGGSVKDRPALAMIEAAAIDSDFASPPTRGVAG